jgi:hypothetical protein
MIELSQKASEMLNTNAMATLFARDLFKDEQIESLSKYCEQVDKERIIIGDVGERNDVLVGRFMHDIKGECPKVCNGELGESVLAILQSKKSVDFFRGIMGGDFYIRRIQSNILSEGSYIGEHIDTYSNLTYTYSVVIQFGKDYEGGEFFVNYNDQVEQIKTTYGDMLVNRCEIPHGVKKVTKGHRKSLVFFLSKSPMDEANNHNNQI